MPIEDDTDEDENIIKDTNREVVLRFNNPSEKRAFLERLERSLTIIEEGYKCGHCAAHPCFRNYGEETPAGLCFQITRRCRQECEFYSYPMYPADGGICKRDNTSIKYNQDCHVPEMRSKVKKE